MDTKIIFIGGDHRSYPSDKVHIDIVNKVVKVFKDDKVILIPFSSIIRVDYPKPAGAKAYFKAI